MTNNDFKRYVAEGVAYLVNGEDKEFSDLYARIVDAYGYCEAELVASNARLEFNLAAF